MVKMKYFPIYIDLLGYEERAIDDAKKIGLDEKDLRCSYVNIIERRLDELKTRGFIEFYNKSTDSDYSDEKLVFSVSIWNAFKIVGEILKAKLPLAIAIGVIEVNERYMVERGGETISYLKTYIISKYKKFYEDKRGKHSLKQTFILLTTEAYKELNSKRACSKPYPSAEFYVVESEKFEKELRTIGFLEKIGSQRKEYREIEDLYVEPKNYNEIINTLEKYNIVFIIGDAEMGKTYTAVRLLWEYSKDYEPLYIPEERKREQWEFIRHKTLFEGKAIYLEDPWGKVEFERAESLFRDIGTFIAEVRWKNCKVIVTSREKVFKEFEKRKETAEDLWRFVNLLKVNLAYSKENLTEILNKYIQVFEPAWSSNEKLKKIAVEAIGTKLRTPMSIKKLIDFSKDIKNIKDLDVAIEEASIETRIAFAREIKEMFNRGDYDNIAFLSFSYIGVKYDIAKSCYAVVIKDLGYSMKGRIFDDLIKEFSEVEIKYLGLRFIHPSYSDAFEFALIDNSKPNNICTKIFSHVLLKLSEKVDASTDVVSTVEHNFDRLPDNVRNELLIRLSEKNSDYGDRIGLNENETLEVVSRVVAINFDKLPETVRNKLLIELSKKYYAAKYVAWIIAHNFDKLPEGIRSLLFMFLEKSEKLEPWRPSYHHSRALAQNKILIASAEIVGIETVRKNVRALAWAVENNFDILPVDVRNKLLLKLSKKEEASEYVARTIVNNFVDISEKIRNDILLYLSKNHATAQNVQDAFKYNYDKLPTDVRNILNLNLGLGGVAPDNFDEKVDENNVKSLNDPKRIKLLKILLYHWEFDYNKFEF